MILDELVSFISQWRAEHPQETKDRVVRAVQQRFGLEKDGALLVGPAFAIRFCQSKFTESFANAVVAIGKVVKHDDRPIVVCVVTPAGCRFLLANTTFLTKVSHSSHALARGHLRGSILGSDILREVQGVQNAPECFAELTRIHARADRTANLERIVAATRAPSTREFWMPGIDGRAHLRAAPALARALGVHPDYATVCGKLDAILKLQRAKILVAARNPNPKTRGDQIESIITGTASQHAVGDIEFDVVVGVLSVDIKSKLSGKASSPKAWNIDKTLQDLAKGRRLLSMYFVRVDAQTGVIDARLVSIFDRTLVLASRPQRHWSGRGTRGAIQLTNTLDGIWSPGYVEAVDVTAAQAFLERLIAIDPTR